MLLDGFSSSSSSFFLVNVLFLPRVLTPPLVNDDETATVVVITVATVVDLVDVNGEGGGARVVGRYANNNIMKSIHFSLHFLGNFLILWCPLSSIFCRHACLYIKNQYFTQKWCREWYGRIPTMIWRWRVGHCCKVVSNNCNSNSKSWYDFQ